MKKTLRILFWAWLALTVIVLANHYYHNPTSSESFNASKGKFENTKRSERLFNHD